MDPDPQPPPQVTGSIPPGDLVPGRAGPELTARKCMSPDAGKIAYGASCTPSAAGVHRITGLQVKQLEALNSNARGASGYPGAQGPRTAAGASPRSKRAQKILLDPKPAGYV